MHRRGGYPVPPGAAAYGGHEHLEEENDSKENELKEKVSLLKQLTIDIGDEVKEHNRLLKDADDTFDSVGNVMSATIGKVKELAKSGYKYYFLYLFIFVLFVVIVLWWNIWTWKSQVKKK